MTENSYRLGAYLCRKLNTHSRSPPSRWSP